MIRALITGSLYGSPASRTSQAGKDFTTAKLRADGKDGATVWTSLVAFGELAERLATLPAGAALAVSGRAELSAWLDKAGEPKAGLSLVVDELATLKGKPRPVPVEAEGQERATGQSTGQHAGHFSGHRQPRRPPRPAPVATGPDFDDELPDFM